MIPALAAMFSKLNGLTCFPAPLLPAPRLGELVHVGYRQAYVPYRDRRRSAVTQRRERLAQSPHRQRNMPRYRPRSSVLAGRQRATWH
jgi:hypothetical protein